MGVADNKTYKNMYHFNNSNYVMSNDDVPSMAHAPQINTTIKENPYRSNVEIEKDEIILQPDLKALSKALGKRHSGGGIDVTLKPNTFVFSNDKSLAFGKKDHDVFEFKKPKNFSKTKNTPAEVLKRHINLEHYNTLIANLEDPTKDDLAKKSSAMMLEKYIETLGNIAYVQEAKKDFPQGMPEFAAGTAPIYDTDLKDEIMEQKQYAKYGGTINNPYMQWGGRFNQYAHQERMERRRALASRAAANKKGRRPVATAPSVGEVAGVVGDVMEDIWKVNMENPFAIPSNTYAAGNRQITSPQHRRTSGMYGEKDWDINDFRSRHDWYFQNNPDWNPSDPEHVRDFQSKYNERSRNIFGNNYFTGSGYRAVDSKFGEFTFNAPSIRQPNRTTMIPGREHEQIIPKMIPIDRVKPLNVETNLHPPEVEGDPQGWKRADWEFTPWQKVSQMYNLGKVASTKRYMPYRSRFNPSYVDPALVNPEQALGDMRTVANQQAQANQLLSPVLRNAQNAAGYGDLLNRIPGVRSQYDNQNVGIQNQFRAMNNQTANQARQLNMQNDQQYYQQSIIGRQNYDNLREFRMDQYMNNLLGDVQTNQSLAYNLLTQNNPAYNYDWRTGHFTRTNKDIRDVQNSPQADLVGGLLGQLLDPDRFNSLDPRVQSSVIRAATLKGLPLPPMKKGGKVKGKRNPYKY